MNKNLKECRESYLEIRMLYYPSGSVFFLLKGFKSAAFQFPAFGALGKLCE